MPQKKSKLIKESINHDQIIADPISAREVLGLVSDFWIPLDEKRPKYDERILLSTLNANRVYEKKVIIGYLYLTNSSGDHYRDDSDKPLEGNVKISGWAPLPKAMK